jgi:hypothetical protein
MNGIAAGQLLLLSLWTLWLLAALSLLPRPAGSALPIGVAAVGLVLVLTGAVPWRYCVIGGLVVHIVAAVTTIVTQGQGPGQSPGQGPSQGQLRQALLASVSLGGLIWVLILRPTIPWLYPADIPIMIVTVVAVAAAEYGGWILIERMVQRRVDSAVSAERQDASHRAQQVVADLDAERQQRLASDEQNARLRRTVHQLEDERTRQEAELGRREARLSQQDAELRRLYAELQRLQAAVQQSQAELRQSQAELEQSQAELEQSQAELQPSRAGLAHTHAALAGQPTAWYRAPAGVRLGLGPGAPATEVGVILVRLSVDPRAASRADGAVRVIVERAMFPVSPVPGETAGELYPRAEGRLRQEIDGAVAQYAAQAIVEPVWKVAARRWVPTDPAGMNAAAGVVTSFEADLNDLVLGKPVRELGTWAGLPSPAANVLGGIAAAAAMPGDRELDTVVRIIQIGGIVAGALAGHPPLAVACFKSLVRDEAINALEAVISREFSSLGLSRAQAPATPRTPPTPDPRMTPEPPASGSPAAPGDPVPGSPAEPRRPAPTPPEQPRPAASEPPAAPRRPAPTPPVTPWRPPPPPEPPITPPGPQGPRGPRGPGISPF